MKRFFALVARIEATRSIFSKQGLQGVKALYGIHQAPRAWHETMSTYLLENRFRRGIIDKTLFIKKDKGLQVKQKDDGIFISQDKYMADILNKFDFTTVKTPSTLMEPNKALIKDAEAKDGSKLHQTIERIFRYLKAMGVVMNLEFKLVVGKRLVLNGCLDWPNLLPTSAKVKTINEDVRLQALVDGKNVIVNEASIRRDLRLDDAEGTACLLNADIFEELARIGTTMASAIICLANNQKFTFSKYIFECMMKNLEVRVKFLMYPRFVQVFIINQLGDMSHHKGIFVNQSLTKKGRMNDQDMFGVNNLDGDAIVVDVSAREKEEQSEKVVEKEVSTADPVTTAGEVVTTADVEVSVALTTTTTADDEWTFAQTLIEIKDAKPKALTTAATIVLLLAMPKEKGIIMQEPFKTPSPKPIVSSQQPSQPKDKGKAKMVEPERPLKWKEHIIMDEQIARDFEAQMQAGLEEEQRIAKQKEKEANIAMIAE
uniref:Reverse transcriptase Ty1/copia-type domain-containing protein n=1 Tax=Tanacetum cinerariifolium TaxID=118510 RepID=A0A6L2LZX0_TANCI|nr:hypothetical protein [Tanacetum cinerariifolium]